LGGESPSQAPDRLLGYVITSASCGDQSLASALTEKKKRAASVKEAALLKLRNSSHRCAEPFGSQKFVSSNRFAAIVCKRQQSLFYITLFVISVKYLMRVSRIAG